MELRGVEGLPEIRPGDDLAAFIAEAAAPLLSGDVVVVAQKVVSKAEGRLRTLSDVVPSDRALELARSLDADARLVQVILDESTRIVRADRVLIVETHQGFVCANAGVDRSNVAGQDEVCLLPLDCDSSARVLRERISTLTGAHVGVVVSDTFGRAWRMGLVNVAIGVAGLPALIDYRGRPDDFGMPLRATVVAVADEIAAAAELLMGKTRRVPVVIVHGLDVFEGASGTGQELVRPPELDLFR
ncbi:MAG TPA: coenzyme F420-0:L-glutamate ligase [Candidatus Acidoferrales bacterium]|nr:coenzyme F420-0:L-glutamate ligase [Candidatus Acidoferrales bacterium]